MTEQQVEDVEQVWRSIPAEEKRQLISFYKNSATKPWRAADQGDILALPVELLRFIAGYFWRDAETFHNFAFTCRYVKGALGDFEQVADKRYVAPWVHRLINRANRLRGLKLRIRCHKVFDDKCRYIDIQQSDRLYCAKIDKLTGLILTFEAKMPRGYVTDDRPEEYFGPYGHLIFVKDMEKANPAYKARRKDMIEEFKEATKKAKNKGMHEKRTFYASQWDETPQRKKALLCGKSTS